MALNIGLLNWASNLGVNIETALLILILLGCLIFFAKGFTFGIVMSFLGAALGFMLIYGLHITYDTTINYAPSLVVMFMCLIVMAFTLYSATQSTAIDGGLV